MDPGGVRMMDEVSKEVEYYSYRYLDKKEIAIVTGALMECLNDPDHPIGRAFLAGRYKRKAEFNDSVIQLSKQLSSPAMQIEQRIAEQTFINDSKTR